MSDLKPAHIMQIGSGFWASKTLLSAVELGLFTALVERPLTAEELRAKLGLSERAMYDFPDALVALKLLDRDGDGPDARYKNTPEGAKFLDKNSPAYIGSILEMFNARLYRFWVDLTEGVKTGKPQNEVKHTGEAMFTKVYSDPARLEQFVTAMVGLSGANFRALAEKFDFSKYKTLVDVGGATGQLCCLVHEKHPHLQCTSWDLPLVKPIADRYVAKAGMTDKVKTAAGDFLQEDLPKADVITMGMILHNWGPKDRAMLIKKAYDALPEGGAFIVIENIIDDARRQNAFGLLMSLNMIIEYGDARDFTSADFAGWCREVGFKEFKTIPLAGAASAAIAYK